MIRSLVLKRENMSPLVLIVGHKAPYIPDTIITSITEGSKQISTDKQILVYRCWDKNGNLLVEADSSVGFIVVKDTDPDTHEDNY